MFGFRKFLSGINIIPKIASTANSMGDLDVTSGNGKLNYFNGTISSPVVTESGTAVLVNKTIDADTNTITNIENADIKALAAIDATKIADGSVTSTEFQYLNGVTSDIQTQLDGKQATGNYITDLTGDVTASGPGSVASTVALVGGKSATEVATSVDDTQAATDANTPSTIVKRDASGNFSAGTITATLSGNATNVSGTVAIANGGTGQTSKAAAFDALSPMTTGGDLIYGGASGTGTRLPNGTSGYILTSNGGTAAPSWEPNAAASYTAPLITKYTSPGSGTHTFTGSPLYVRITLVGGGGGGGGSGTGGGGGGSFNDSTFDTCTAGGGAGGAFGANGGAGGTATLGSGYVGIAVDGGDGATVASAAAGANASGGSGGQNALGGAGQCNATTNGQGTAAKANTGAGGGGAESTVGGQTGSGGGAGAYINAVVSGATLAALAGSASYTVATTGAGGTAGSGGFVGGAGAAGLLIVEEYYQ